MVGANVTVNAQEPHEMSALINAQPRKLRAQLLGSMACSEAGEPAPQRLYFPRAIEPEQSAERSRVAFLEILRPLAADCSDHCCSAAFEAQ
jgi:hypothetical protein